MSEQESKEAVEKLSNLREEALEKIKQYNELAHEIDLCERLGLASSGVDTDYWDDEYNVKDSYDTPYVVIDTPGVQGYWFPSGVNC